MGSKQMRVGQLIAPFGPGSIYTDRKGVPHIICGLDYWFKRRDNVRGWVDADGTAEFQSFEPRLADLLHVDRFCCPPDFRAVRRGDTPAPNAGLHVPALRFPRWYRHTKTGEMKRFNLHSIRTDIPVGGGRWLPVRFVSLCEAGHLCEFPWKEWIGCVCEGDGNLVLTDRGGSELSSIRVECKTCPPSSQGQRGKTLAGTTMRPDVAAGEKSAFEQAGILCTGDRPWLGEDANEAGCTHARIGALINQTNLYFPRTISAILLPDVEQRDQLLIQIRNEIEASPADCGVAKTLWNMGSRGQAVAMIKESLRQRRIDRESQAIEKTLEALFTKGFGQAAAFEAPSDPESDLVAFRRQEFNVIRDEINDSVRVPNLRVLRSKLSSETQDWVSRVTLVERLRETRVFYGFDRLEPSNSPLDGMPLTAMRQLFLDQPAPQDRWLPAVEVFGEGIFVELSETAIRDWQDAHRDWITSRVTDPFVARLSTAYQTLPPLGGVDWRWASKYLLVHTFAHTLINQLVFECGYSTASLRERLYVSTDSTAPMAGLLVYTAAGDSDGTLGGLVSLGRPERFGRIVQSAVNRASWCSADPVCSEAFGRGATLNLSACHACVLLPETSCETINHGLDRSMIVGTPEEREHGFLASMLDMAYALD